MLLSMLACVSMVMILRASIVVVENKHTLAMMVLLCKAVPHTGCPVQPECLNMLCCSTSCGLVCSS